MEINVRDIWEEKYRCVMPSGCRVQRHRAGNVKIGREAGYRTRSLDLNVSLMVWKEEVKNGGTMIQKPKEEKEGMIYNQEVSSSLQRIISIFSRPAEQYRPTLNRDHKG